MLLPTVNALLNLTSAVFLVCGYSSIRRKKTLAHRNGMLAAFAASVLFLIFYIVYHLKVGSVRFTKEGWVRPLYFGILISHTSLALAVVPLALRTLYLALRRRFEEHRKIARWTFPIWLYVSTTGVVVYLMLYLL